MKNVLLILSITVLTTSIVDAQNMNRPKIKLLKTSFITDAINLSPAEAEKFWPVYNLYTDKIQQLKQSLDIEIREAIISAGGIENISETDAQITLDQILLLEQQIGNNKVKLINELTKIISAKKIIILQKAERDFNRQILQEFGRRKRLRGQ